MLQKERIRMYQNDADKIFNDMNTESKAIKKELSKKCPAGQTATNINCINNNCTFECK